MRYIVRAALPLAEGRILDPFMGGGSTIAATENIGYSAVGVELDEEYYNLALSSIPLLATLYSEENTSKALASPFSDSLILQTQLF